MTNVNNPAGARITGAIISANFNTLVHEYIVAESDSTDLFIGDFVKDTNTSENGIPIVTQAASGEKLRGIVVAFKPDRDLENITYRPAGIRRTAYICDDPNIEFEIQVNGTIASTDIGKNAEVVVAPGNEATGLSGSQVDLTTITTGNAQLKILAIIERPENEFGLYTKVRAIILEHDLRGSGGSGTSKHNDLLNLTYDLAGHGTGFTGFQRGTTQSASDPTVNDDSSLGYVAGDFWLNTSSGTLFNCLDNSIGAAVWDAIEQGIHWQEAIKDQVDFTSAEPAAPATGDRYINTGTGVSSITAQAVTATYIYEWNGSSWSETIPLEGYAVWDEAGNEYLIFNGSAWVTLGATQSFLDLTDTPSSYTTAHSVYKVNSGTSGVVESSMTVDDSGNVYIPGKLTVIGLVDPTGFIATPQASPPSTDDGTIYYDSVTKKFLFREDGAWDDISATSIWDKAGTEVSLKVLTDTIAPGTPLHYTTHPTFSGDTDLIDKKYADDLGIVLGEQDLLTVTGDGQTAFTLSQPLVAGSVAFAHVRGHFFEYGYGFTAIGTSMTWLDPDGLTLKTTDRLVITYNYNLGSSTAPEYWQRISNYLLPATVTDDIGATSARIVKGWFTDIESTNMPTVGGTSINANGVLDLTSAEVTQLANIDTTTISISQWGYVGAMDQAIATSDAVSFSGVSVASGTFQLATGTTVNEIVTAISGASTGDQLCTAKAAWDAIAPEAIWDRTLSEISVQNSGDTIDFSTAGVIKSASFDSANIPSYNSVPTLTADEQLVYKKYVDDQVGLDFNQLQIYYVGSNGNDTFSGLRINNPFATPHAAANAINLQTPSPTNRFAIYVIDEGTFNGAGTAISNYTTFYAPRAELTGTWSLGTESNLFARKVKVSASTTAISVSSGANHVVKVDEVSDLGATNATFISVALGGTVYLDTKDVSMITSGSKLFSLVTGGALYHTGDKVRYDTVSSTAGGALVEIVLASGNDTYISNKTGTVYLEGKNAAPLVVSAGTLEAFRIDTVNPQWTNTSLFEARLSASKPSVTGDGATYKVPFNVAAENIGTDFSTSNSWYVTTTKALYGFSFKLGLFGILAENDSFGVALQVDDNSTGLPVKTIYLKDSNISNEMDPAGQVIMSGHHEVVLTVGYRVYLIIAGSRSSGSGNNIGVNPQDFSSLSGRLIRKLQ